MMPSRMLWVIAVLAMVKTSIGIQTRIQWPTQTQKQPCHEHNLQLICACDSFNKVLNVTSFQQLNIHSTTVNSITIQNCEQVFLGSNALQNLQSLRNLDIVQVADLILSDNALNWTGYQTTDDEQFPSLHINIKDTRVSKMGRFVFHGAPAEIKLENNVFDQLGVFSFASLSKLLEINIKDSVFKRIDSQAFKGIQTRKFSIHNSTFGTVPSSTFRDLDITESFTISNSKFDILKSQAFIIKQPKHFEISGSNFAALESEAFLVRAKGTVIMQHNNFGNLDDRAFMGITYVKESKITPNQDFVFSDNKLNRFEKNWIVFDRTSFNPKYGAIILNQSCSCVDIEIWFNNNEIKEHIHCVNDTLRQTTIQAEIFRKRVCESGTKTWIILVSVFSVLLVLLIIAIVVFVFVYRRYKKRKQTEYVNRGQAKKGSVGLIVPDGRTYRETEVHVIVEKAELLTTEL